MELQISVLFPTFHHTNSWFYCKVNSLNSLSIFMCYMERAAQSHGRYHSGDHNLKKDKSRLRLSKHLLCLALFCLIQMLFSGILGDFLHLTHFKKINFYFTNIEKNGEQTSFIECQVGKVHLVICWQQKKFYCSNFTQSVKYKSFEIHSIRIQVVAGKAFFIKRDKTNLHYSIRIRTTTALFHKNPRIP